VIDGVHINVDTTPGASVIGSNRYDPETWLDAFEMLDPKVIRGRLPDNGGLPVLLSILPLLLNLVRSVRNV
jgi:hypothetical protein